MPSRVDNKYTCALIGKNLFGSLFRLFDLISVSWYRIDFEPGYRHITKVVSEKCGDQKAGCQKKYFHYFIHLAPLETLLR